MKHAHNLALLLPLLFVLPLSAQRLTVENPDSLAEQITLYGNVVEVKKYSFVIDAGDKKHTVKLAKGVKLELNLHKPLYKPQNKKLLVLLPGTDDNPVREEIQLPEKLFVRVKFAHQNQMNRIMSASPKRLNNYQLSPNPFPPAGQELAIAGQLVVGQEEDRYRLKTPDAIEHDIILGQHDASMVGFSIHDLKPMTTQVKVKGVLKPDAIIASKAVFWPIGKN